MRNDRRSASFFLVGVLVVLVGCLESDPQPSPSSSDVGEGRYYVPGADTTSADDGYYGSNDTCGEVSVPYDVVSPGEDASMAQDCVSDSASVPDEPVAPPVANPFIETSEENTSTFSIDVDTASYTIMRMNLQSGSLPNPDGVRVEEYVNYFNIYYPQPDDEHPFSINLDAAPSYFGEDYKLLRIGLQGYEVPEEELKDANLVFLVDVSGSMSSPGKLTLVKFFLTTLVDHLQPNDTLGIVVYAGTQAVLLEPTPVQDVAAIKAAINGLGAGGSTAGAAGIATAYELAEGAMKPGGINRVILCTDGDFNVGLTGSALIAKIEEYREKGVTLSVFGFGMSGYNDEQMEQLADNGNGNYGFIDSQAEVLKVIEEKLFAILQVIAKDVKIQIEFNADTVFAWRLLGYENRVMENQEFTNDKKDAGEIGSGHNVTAFYELEMTPEYADASLAEVRFRYKQPDGVESIEIIRSFDTADIEEAFEAAASDFRFGAAVVEFAEILRNSEYTEGARFDEILEIATAAGGLETDERIEFLDLIEIADSLWP